jgi:hypothetical protein
LRIIVATTHTIPGFSGGWTTPLDLFGNSHDAMYVIKNSPAVYRRVEGIPVLGTGSAGCLGKPWAHLDRYREALSGMLFRAALSRSFKAFRADFLMCLDPGAGYAAMRMGLPYAMRFHSKLLPQHMGDRFPELLGGALFNISGPTTGVAGVEEIPHNQDLSRFIYSEAETANRALLLTSIDDVHEPELFIEGVTGSKSFTGDIVGTGPQRMRIARLCNATGGRVRCLKPVQRLRVPRLLTEYQVGVATVRRISPVVYQMKVNAYMAAGLLTLAKPWAHISVEAPELVRQFTTAMELARCLDQIAVDWKETLETRRAAREWIHRNYSVDIPRQRFNEILAEVFGSTNLSMKQE